MTIQTWPTSIDKFVLRDGFSQKARENTIRTQMDAGIDKVRRRYTTPVIEINFNKWLTFAQYETLETFYNVTLQGGVLSFYFDDPATGDPYEHRFLQAPSYSAMGGYYYNVSFSLERLD